MVEVFATANGAQIERGFALSLLTAERVIAIGRAMQEARFIPGDTAEVGIAAGGTTRIIAAANGGKHHWACDTFDGLVDVGAHDGDLTNKMFQNVFPKVSAELADVKDITLVRGYFPQSAPPEMADARFAFVHIDVDTYQSVLNCFDFFAPRMSPGGLMALDDVLPIHGRTPGAQRAWREIYARRDSTWEVASQTPPQIILRFP